MHTWIPANFAIPWCPVTYIRYYQLAIFYHTLCPNVQNRSVLLNLLRKYFKFQTAMNVVLLCIETGIK